MVLIFNDISEQYHLREAIAKSKNNLQAIMDNSPSIIYVKDVQGDFIFINQQFEEILHVSSEEIIGNSGSQLLPKDFYEHIIQKEKAVFSSGTSLDSEEEIAHDDGSHIYVSTTFPLLDRDEKIYGICSISTDNSERLEQELLIRRTQKMDALGQLSGGVAHDFNNQLGIVIGYLDYLKKSFTVGEKEFKWVDTSIKATLRCMDLTRQLLVFSSHQVKEKKVADINLLLKDMEHVIARSLTPAVEVIYQLSDDLWQTEVDVGEFQDAILNLVINARDALPAGGNLYIETGNKVMDVESEALIQEVEVGEYVQIMVSDTGIGMTGETIEHIFEPFFTTKPEGKGTGLGLAMVYGFVKRHNGLIKFYSEPDMGTTVRIYFPRSANFESTTVFENINNEELPTGSESILIVDDEVELLELAEQYLTELGYHVCCAKNGAQAMSILAEDDSVDLLFSDVVMPGGMNGYKLAQEATMQRPQLKVLLTSGFTTKINIEDGLARFVANLLGKPYRKADLAYRIRLVLDEKVEV